MIGRGMLASVAVVAVAAGAALAATRGEPLATVRVAAFAGPFDCDGPVAEGSRAPTCVYRVLDARVDVLAADGSRVLRLRTGRDGRASAALPPGRYRVVPRRTTPAARRFTQPLARDATLEGGASIDVIVDYPTGEQ